MFVKEFEWPKSTTSQELSLIGMQDFLSTVKEVDRYIPMSDLKIRDDLFVDTGEGYVRAQRNFFNNLASMLKYPKKNFSTDLEIERVAGDLNQLISTQDENEPVIVRYHNEVLYAAYPKYGKKFHIPPYLKQSFFSAKDYGEGLLSSRHGPISVQCDVINGDLKVSFLLDNVNVAFPDDPSYVGINLFMRNSDWPGISTGYLLKRTACDNSTIFTIDKSWRGALGDPGDSLELYERSLTLGERYIPALQPTYREMVDTKISDELAFREWKDMVKRRVGRHTDLVLHNWLEEDSNGLKYFDPEIASSNGKNTVYDMFNDITWYARKLLEDDQLEKAQMCAGDIFNSFFKHNMMSDDINALV